jgi:hypothetical protein
MCFALEDVKRYPLLVGDKGSGTVMDFGARLVPACDFNWTCIGVY